MSCTHFEFEPWEQDAAAYGVSLVAVSDTEPTELRRFRKASHIRTPVVYDAGGALASKLNAYYAGRILLL